MHGLLLLSFTRLASMIENIHQDALSQPMAVPALDATLPIAGASALKLSFSAVVELDVRPVKPSAVRASEVRVTLVLIPVWVCAAASN